MIFFTSDEHYYHHNILMHRQSYSGRSSEYTHRPFRTTDEMHRVLRKHHNEVVGTNDTVYHLGDGYGFCESPAIPYTRIFFHWQSLLHTTLHFSKIKNGATLEFVASEEKNNKTGVMEWRAYKVKVIKNGN